MPHLIALCVICLAFAVLKEKSDNHKITTLKENVRKYLIEDQSPRKIDKDRAHEQIKKRLKKNFPMIVRVIVGIIVVYIIYIIIPYYNGNPVDNMFFASIFVVMILLLTCLVLAGKEIKGLIFVKNLYSIKGYVINCMQILPVPATGYGGGSAYLCQIIYYDYKKEKFKVIWRLVNENITNGYVQGYIDLIIKEHRHHISYKGILGRRLFSAK